MSKTPDAVITWISSQNPDWTQTDATIAATLNSVMVPNPIATAPQVARSMAESDLANILDNTAGGSLSKVLNFVNFASVKADIAAGNHAGVALWGPKLALLGLISSTEATAIQSYASGTIADPAWTANIPSPVKAIGRLLDSEDISAARTKLGK